MNKPLLNTLSVIVPAYNEAENIAPTVLGAASELQGLIAQPIQWIIVDDGSTDQTWEEIQKLHSQLPNLTVGRHPERRGLGAAIWTGVKLVQSDWCCWIPADRQISPQAVIDMIRQAESYDGILLMRNEAKRNPLRRTLTTGFYLLMKLSFGFNPYGFSGTFLIRADYIADLPLHATTAVQNYVVVLHALQKGCRWGQVYTDIQPRLSGKSKVANWRTVIQTFYEIARLRLKR